MTIHEFTTHVRHPTRSSRDASVAARLRRGVKAVCLLALAATLTPISAARAQQVGYTLTPTFTHAAWHEQFGLEPTTMWGGRLSLDFGQFVSLQPFYQQRANVGTRLGRTSLRDEAGEPLGEQNVDVRHYGADLVVLFGGGTVSPMLRGGGSVLRLDPDTRGPIRLVGMNYGTGLRFGRAHQMSFDILGSIHQFRLNRLLLAPDTALLEPDAVDPDRDVLRRTLSLTAGVNIPIGGPATFDDRPPTLRWSHAAFPVELFGGQLNFGDATGLDRQQLLGARVGVDLARAVGLRGFYWRGMEDGFSRTAPLQSWGAEAQLQLNSGPGLSPILIGGVGQLDYRGDLAEQRRDATMLIAGAGLALPLTGQLRLNLAARDHIFTAADLNEPGTANQLRHNWLFSAGVGFVIGGGADARREEIRRLRAERERLERERLMRERLERERQEQLRADARREVREEVRDELVAARAGEAQRKTDRVAAETDRMAAETGDRTVAVPVPREGELYVRYGPDDAREGERRGHAPMMRTGRLADRAGMAEIREAVREIIRQELDRDLLVQALVRRDDAAGRAPEGRMDAAPEGRMDAAAERRIADRVTQMLRTELSAELDSLRRDLRRDLAADTRQLREREEILIERTNQAIERAVRQEIDRHIREGTFAAQAPQPARAAVDTVAGEAVVAEPQRRAGPSLQPRQWWGYTGFGVTGSQMLIGARADLGAPWLRYPDLHLVPELSLGFFGGARTTMLAGNLQYTFPEFRLGGYANLRPFVNGGLGLLAVRGGTVAGRDGTEAVLNLGYGVGWPIGGTVLGGGPSEVFIEHQGVDLFSLNRLLVGLRAGF